MYNIAMTDPCSNGSFENQAESYFYWSWKNGGPETWNHIERPAIISGIQTALESLNMDSPRCLDVGIGAGKVTVLLNEMGIPYQNIDGLDISQRILDLVSTKLPDIQLFLADIADENLLQRFSDRQPYDIITASMLLNHLDDNQLRMCIRNIYSLLRDHGFFIGLVPFRPFSSNEFSISNSGMYREEETQWGNNVIYHHTSFLALYEYFELSGFITHIQAVGNEEKFNRVLITAQKYDDFKQALYERNMSIENASWKNYVQH